MTEIAPLPRILVIGRGGIRGGYATQCLQRHAAYERRTDPAQPVGTGYLPHWFAKETDTT